MTPASKFPFYPPVLLPSYHRGRFGRWYLDITEGTMPGYFTPNAHSSKNMPVLKRREGSKDVVWMSLTLMERESHMPHIAAAHGNVLVMGLGMGMYLYNIAQKTDVDNIVVVERDKQVIALLPQITNFDQWPGREKITIVKADALKFHTDERFDFVYADIWKHMADKCMGQDIGAIRRNVPNSNLYGYWTQEWDYLEYRKKRNLHFGDLSFEHYKAWVESMNMPLVGQDDPIYHLYAVLAPTIQVMAKLAIEGALVKATAVQYAVDHLISKITSYRSDVLVS